MDPIVRRLGLAISHLHVKGQPMADAGPMAGRPAKRHDASIGGTKAASVAEMNEWLGRLKGNVAADAELGGRSVEQLVSAPVGDRLRSTRIAIDLA